MDNDNVVSGLIRRRQEIADTLEKTQAALRQLIHDIDAIDTTIWMFRPDIEIGAVRVKPLARRHAASRYEASRLIFAVLREASEPLTTRETVRAIMEARGMSPVDLGMAETMQLRLATSLWKLRHRGKLLSDKENGWNMRWSLAGDRT